MTDDLSKTLIIPNPGGRRAPVDKHTAPVQSPMQPPTPPAFQPQAPNVAMPNDAFSVINENVILSAGSELLTLASNLRSLEPQNTIVQLRTDIEKLITHFEAELTGKGCKQEVILTARYIICCLLDEFVLSTPWGSEGAWSQQTLLSKYHNETWGGEKFFLIADKLLENADKNIDLIELAYVCLSVGFCGKYKVSQQGEQALIQISQKLYQQIEVYRPVPRDLSPSWQAEHIQGGNIVKRVPTWLVFLLLAFLLSAAYVGFISSLKSKVEPIYERLESIGWQDFIVKTTSNKSNLTLIEEKLQLVFKAEIEAGLFTLTTLDNMPVIRFTSVQLFSSGSSKVNKQVLPEVNKLVEHIKQFSDTLLVVGHTDSTGKADSNWVISRKRAEAIAAWLNTANSPIASIITRGVADTQPLFNDDNDEFKQSQNRRVELLLVLKGS